MRKEIQDWLDKKEVLYVCTGNFSAGDYVFVEDGLVKKTTMPAMTADEYAALFN